MAAAIQRVDLEPFKTQVIEPPATKPPICKEGDETITVDIATGKMTHGSHAFFFGEASPAIDPTPVFRGGSSHIGVWGRGWTSDVDHSITFLSSSSILWNQGDGAQVPFFATATSTALPVFVPRVNTYERMSTVSASSGVPTVIHERDKDGTIRRFEIVESSAILRLVLLTDSNGNTVEYTRDGGTGRLTHIEDIHGRYFNLSYNGVGLVQSLSDSAGRTTTLSYDSAKRRTSETGPNGTMSYQYDVVNRMTRITFPNGGVKNYTYDAFNRVLSENEGAGIHTNNYAYYASSTTITDAAGKTIKYDYVNVNGVRKVSKITDANGGIQTFSYDANLNMTASVDANGRTTTYSYDSSGNVIQADDAAMGHTYMTYNATFSKVASLTDPLGRATYFSYDSEGNQTLITNALSGTIAKDYDSFGHVEQLTDPLNHSTDFTYETTNGAVETISDPLSRVTNMVTDSLSRVTQNTDPAGKVTAYEYDTAGNLLKVTDALSQETNYSYQAGRDRKLLRTVTDANSHATTFDYDAQGRLIKVTNALGKYRTSQYNADGTLSRTVNARGQAINYTYDSLKRLTRKAAPEGNIDYTYDPSGNMLTMSHYNGSGLSMTYDALNRVTQVIQTLPGGYAATIGYGYDAAGNRTSMTTPWGNFSYQYDALNRLTQITNPQSRVFSFQYDAAGRRTQLNYPNGIQTTYGYDNANQLLSIIHTRTSDSAVIAKSTYSYDNAGNRLSMTDVYGTHRYNYDDLHRLSSATHPSASSLPPVEAFSYDPVGNRLADMAISSYAYNNANQLTANSSFTYTYDYDGNRTKIEDKLTSAATSFSFNSENQLVGAVRPNSESWTYKYDRLGRRVEKSSGTASSQKYHFVYDGDNILAVLDGNNTALRIFTNTVKIDGALSYRKAAGSDRYLHTNALGSVSALSDETASLSEQYGYTVYGKTTVFNSSGTLIDLENREGILLFTRKIVDDETGLQFNNNRTLDGNVGAFTSEDPLGITAGVNLYLYADAQPTGRIDPLGLYTAIVISENKFGIGEHSGMAVINGKSVTIYDPSGSFVPTTAEPSGSGRIFYGDARLYSEYLKYQAPDGYTHQVVVLNTTPAEEAAILAEADSIGGGSGFSCAMDTSGALRAVSRFGSISAMLPGSLLRQTRRYIKQ